MLKIKHGVKLSGIRPEILVGMMVAKDVVDAHNIDCVITCGLDGKHMAHSKHITGFAIDLRSREFTKEQIDDVLHLLKTNLGEEFDVLFEGNHFHVEFDPEC